MTITESGLGSAVLDRDYLEASLSQRRAELRTALRFYSETRLSPAPRAVLAESTRAAIVEIDAALAMMHKSGYGVCEQCRQPLPIRALTLRPLELHCRDCDSKVPAGPTQFTA
jgi:RNA polymerase-binding transcription factor DksA